jgi:hypothetical protein
MDLPPIPASSACSEPAPKRLEAAEFFLEHGRPRTGRDPIAPWHYRGWPRVGVLAEACWIPRETVSQMYPVLDRWLYHLETIESGRFLDRPIPQLSFSNRIGNRLCT